MNQQVLIENENRALRVENAQKLRFRRYLMAVATYLIGAFMIGLLVWLDYLTAEDYLYFIGLMIFINALFLVYSKVASIYASVTPA